MECTIISFMCFARIIDKHYHLADYLNPVIRNRNTFYEISLMPFAKHLREYKCTHIQFTSYLLFLISSNVQCVLFVILPRPPFMYCIDISLHSINDENEEQFDRHFYLNNHSYFQLCSIVMFITEVPFYKISYNCSIEFKMVYHTS